MREATTLTTQQLSMSITQWGLLYGLITITLLLCSMNYAISLGYFLSFLLMSLGIVALLHTWHNLAHLTVEVLPTQTPVFAGDITYIPLKISNPTKKPRYAIKINYPNQSSIIEDISDKETSIITFPIQTKQRGWLNLLPFTLDSEFPLGLLRVSITIDHTQTILTYAALKAYTPFNESATKAQTDGDVIDQFNKGSDEFIGHQNYQAGDALNRVDWKASSRKDTLLIKQYAANVSSTLWLDWDATEGFAFEDRVSMLTHAVVNAYQNKVTFGLTLPSMHFPPKAGVHHYHECLKALALL